MQHIPRKRFGQNFLRDQAIIHRIVGALAPKAGEHLIEIGPGQGAITLPVLRMAKQLEVVELDRDLIPDLKDRVSAAGSLTVYEADALQFDFASIRKDNEWLRVFGNLPYNISTPLIFHLLSYASIISDMLFMLQKEVAERLAAEPGTEGYSRLSVMAQYYCRAELLFHVPPTAFYPPPKVDSSIIRLIPHATLPFVADDEAFFAEIVKHAFGQRRKTLRNSLKNHVHDDTWADVQIHSDRRPETLSVEEFVKIANVACRLSKSI